MISVVPTKVIPAKAVIYCPSARTVEGRAPGLPPRNEARGLKAPRATPRAARLVNKLMDQDTNRAPQRGQEIAGLETVDRVGSIVYVTAMLSRARPRPAGVEHIVNRGVGR
jgi:hypothetical protein